ncbi:MAG TPA: polymorphic toxin-type HINT domain-containing protein [Solirubrobacteraceae bacterium]|jgi:hypothetical protein|nr:polymorphic toxin-type HINT domain-containing protein [Solirubrobacteraceae bacterium]
MRAQRQALGAKRSAFVAEAERLVKLKKQLFDQQAATKDPVLKNQIRERLHEAEAQRKQAVDAANDLYSEINDFAKDIAKQETVVERAEIEADPAGHRAGLPCFAGETLVWAADGPRRIDELRVGDPVLSYDLNDATFVHSRVSEVFENRTMHLYELRAGGETIRATGRHRFWVPDRRRWIATREIEEGMVLHGRDGERVVVERIARHEADDEPSWNLAIETTPHYFVGPGVLVHNQGGVDIGLGGRVVIYRITNPKFPGKVYIGQTVDITVRWRTHRRDALVELKNRSALTAKEVEFFEFMSGSDPPEVLVKGIKTKAQADFLEQKNMDIETKLRGDENVMNRREQIRSDTHMKEVVEQITSDPDVVKAGKCPG